MMTVLDIIQQAESLGVVLAVQNGKLRGKNLGGLDDATRDRIRQHKSEIIQLLAVDNSKPEVPGQDQPRRLAFREPSLNTNGELIIPFECNQIYKWWTGGQSIFETLLELGATDETISRYVDPINDPETYNKWMNHETTRTNETRIESDSVQI